LFWAFLIPHIFVNIVSLILFSLRGQSRVIIKSKWNALRGIPTMWKERIQLQRSRVASVPTLWRIIDKRWILHRPVPSKTKNRAD
jgi:hypothetical protein